MKLADQNTIWMIKGRERVAFKTWEEYEEAGKPSYEVVTADVLERYKAVEQFTVRRRSTK
jgi:hypothetical protein